MNDKSHQVNCAILSTAITLLKCGLEDLLTESCKTKKFSYKQVSKLCGSVVLSQATVVTTNLISLIGRLRCGYDINISDQALKRVIVDNSLSRASKIEMNFSKMGHGDHGRMLCATQGVPRGVVLLRESPYVCCLVAGCGCREGQLLVEHIDIACTISLSSRDRNQQRYHQFLDTFFSGLSSKEEDATSLWSSHMQYVMMVVAAVRTLYCALAATNASDATSTDTTSVDVALLRLDRGQFEKDSLELLEVLARIPANLHAISKVVVSCEETRGDAKTDSLQQVRAGYGLFLGASAVNHSCCPNAAIRFTGSKNNSSKSQLCVASDVGDVGQLGELMRTWVEVTSTRSLARQDEVTVSYGPMAGKHDLATRNQCLRSQYLFDCHCAACVEDLDQQQRDRQLSGEYSTRSGPNAVADTTNLCKVLEHLNGVMGAVNAEFTQLLQTQRDRPASGLLLEFEQQRVMPLKMKLEQLQSKYFPHNMAAHRTKSRQQNRLKTAALTVDTADSFLFAQFWGVYCSCLDLHAHLLATRGEFAIAASMVETAIEHMVSSGQHAEDDVAIGRERVKLAQLYLSAGNLAQCCSVAQRAQSDLRPFVGDDDPDWVEVCHMLTFFRKQRIRTSGY